MGSCFRGPIRQRREHNSMTKRAYGLAGLALFLLAVLIAQRSGVL